MTIARTICLGFLTVIAIGTLLLMMPFATSSGNWNDPIVALFTSTSAVCVTGLIVVDTGSYFSFWGELIILLLIQVGGLGYMTINTFLILLIGLRFNLKQRSAIQQTFDRPFLFGSRNLVRSIIAMTVLFELTGCFLLLPVFADFDRPLWQALFHSVSAWNNAGFSLFEDSLTVFRSSILANLVVSMLIIFGGLGYEVIFEIYAWIANVVKGNSRIFVFSLNLKVVTSTTIALLIIGTFAFLFTDLINNEAIAEDLTIQERLLAAWFQSVTTRTAGFNTIDIGALSEAALFITIALMFVGASPSGTGGGIKTTTLRVLIDSTRAILRGKNEVVVFQRRLPNSMILKTIGVLCGSVAVVVAVTIIVAILNPELTFLELLFEVVSAYATVGLSTGITAQLSAVSKLVLVLTMYIGRIGILIIIGALIGEPRPSVIQYPEETLLVG